MPAIPCVNQVTCPECYDPPLLNLSAEAPDSPIYLSNRPAIPHEPAIGQWYESWLCGHHCFSAISQARADQCASNFIVFCDDDPPPGGDGGPGDDGDDGDGGVVTNNYGNVARSCTRSCPDGTSFSYTVPANTVFSPTSQADADAKADSICQQQAAYGQICFINDELPATCNDNPFSFQFAVAGGTSPYIFTVDPMELPNGMTLTPSGLLSGWPTTAANYPLNIYVTDSSVPPIQTSRFYPFWVVEIVTTSLPDAETGVAYSATLVSNPPGIGLWVVVSGSLPAGLTLNPSTGVISGTPTSSGSSSFTVGLLA